MVIKNKADYLRVLRENPNDRRHGTTTGYWYGCRCEACHEAAMEKQRQNRCGSTKKAKTPKVKDQTKGAAANMWARLFGKPSASNIHGRCMVCGRPANNHHHVIPRSAGEMSVNGHRLSKPTILLCGNGNTSGCHSLAHQKLLHFDWADTYEENRHDWVEDNTCEPGNGHWVWKIYDRPINVLEAWAYTDGWRRLCMGED